ncbi:MAG: DUF4381 domain-containing protein [Desulfuromonas sp.]|nr:MAG: DUF4381 domain-containing protein [Desulfuromonas sp.]
MTPSTVSPQELPLRDIHLPAPVGVWPPAPGWWLLLCLLLLLIVVVWRCRPLLHRWRLRREALRQLEAVAVLPAPQQLPQLSRLLRRIALAWYPAEECAGLYGAEWLAFLDRPFKDAPFSTGCGAQMVEAPYRVQSAEVEPALLTLSQRWVQSLPLWQKRGGRC